MSIIDALRDSVLEGFNTTLSPSDIVLGLATAVAASLFILFIYRRIMQQVALNRSFCISLLLVSTISAMMVLTITSNLALSLGMVGALSIVRFRTAIKDASDTAFLFWAVAVGITSGAGFYLLTLIGCLLIGLVCVLGVLLFDKVDKPFLLVIRAADAAAAPQVESLLQTGNIRFRLSSMLENPGCTEIIYELGVSPKQRELPAAIKNIPGVTSVAMVDCRKS